MAKRTNTKWTLELVKAYYAEHGCEFISPAYKTMLDKYTFICPCGNEHTSRFESFYKHNKRCKQCAAKELSERRKLSKKTIVSKLKDRGFTYVNHYYVTSEVAKTDRRWLHIDYICDKGHLQEGKVYQGVVTSKYACTECIRVVVGDAKRLPIQKVKEILAEKGMELLSDDYVNNVTPINVNCVCGTPYSTTLSSIATGHRCGCGRRGENHWGFRVDMTDEERQDKRQYTEYGLWVKAVYTRDNHTCQKCGVRGGVALHAHHIYGYSRYEEVRTSLWNGVTLCEADHKLFHSLYGLRGFTAADFVEFMRDSHGQKRLHTVRDNLYTIQFLGE